MLGVGGASAASGLSVSSILYSVAGAGVGGGFLMAIIGVIRKAIGKSS